MATTARAGRLEGKNAVITGAAGGIGLETTILFAREGASVLMADISEPALAKAISKVKETIPHHPRLETIKCDVSKEADVAAMVSHLDSWGGVDIMFNNAGIMHGDDADAIDTPEKIWDLTHNINVKGVWFGSKHAVLSMRRHGKQSGSVINTASVVALVGSATPQLAYTASKGAVLAMTRELAMVHARESIRFNALCPAPLNTALLQDWLGDDAAKRHRREIHFPTGRFGEAIEQAHAVLFLASAESSFVNGTDFVVDGGMTKVRYSSSSSSSLFLLALPPRSSSPPTSIYLHFLPPPPSTSFSSSPPPSSSSSPTTTSCFPSYKFSSYIPATMPNSKKPAINPNIPVLAASVPAADQDATQAYVTPEGPPTAAPANFAR